MQELISKIQARAHDPGLATNLGTDIRDRKGNLIPCLANPPLSEQEVADWERETGFRLPTLLRTLYIQVGDGGFGPGYGLFRMKTHQVIHPASLPGGQETDRYLKICDWGCAIASFLDCKQPAAPVFRFDPNQTAADVKTGIAFTEDAHFGIIYSEYDSLADWLEAWVSGQELFFSTYGLDPAEFEDET